MTYILTSHGLTSPLVFYDLEEAKRFARSLASVGFSISTQLQQRSPNGKEEFIGYWL